MYSAGLLLVSFLAALTGCCYAKGVEPAEQLADIKTFTPWSRCRATCGQPWRARVRLCADANNPENQTLCKGERPEFEQCTTAMDLERNPPDNEAQVSIFYGPTVEGFVPTKTAGDAVVIVCCIKQQISDLKLTLKHIRGSRRGVDLERRPRVKVFQNSTNPNFVSAVIFPVMKSDAGLYQCALQGNVITGSERLEVVERPPTTPPPTPPTSTTTMASKQPNVQNTTMSRNVAVTVTSDRNCTEGAQEGDCPYSGKSRPFSTTWLLLTGLLTAGVMTASS